MDNTTDGTSTRSHMNTNSASTAESQYSDSDSNADTTTAAAITTTTDVNQNNNEKILNDLTIVLEKIEACQTLWNEQKTGTTADASSNTGETITRSSNMELYELFGFLEACAPRMVELVEFCSSSNNNNNNNDGDDDDMVVLIKALDVNDRLIQLLSDFDAVQFTPQPPSRQGETTSDDDAAFDAFLNVRTNETTATAAATAAAVGTSTHDNDLLS